MKFIACPQGTPEWLQARTGAITASMFATAIATVGGLTDQQQRYVDAIRAGATEEAAAEAGGYKSKVKRTETVERAVMGLRVGEPSDGAKKYASDIAIERISGKPYGEPPKAWVLERGHEMEARARMLYEASTGFMAMDGGIFKTDDDWFGYSSDGAIDGTPDGDGLMEIKAPVDTQKIVAMWQTGDVSEYIHQMQGGMWITGRQWCDFIMYVPDLASVGKDLFVKRIYRDDDFINDMVERLMGFRASVMVMESFFRKPVAELAKFVQDEVVVSIDGPPDLFAGEPDQKVDSGGNAMVDTALGDQCEADPLYDEAVATVRKNKKPSISLVQRHLKIGYNRAARLLEDMERAGIVSRMQADGSRKLVGAAA